MMTTAHPWKRTADNAATAADLVADWDDGHVIESLSMGSLGPGDEQTTQLLAIEMVRDNLTAAPPTTEAEFSAFGDSTLDRLAPSLGLLRMSQIVSAKSLASRWLRDGYGAIRDGWRKDPELRQRIILVSNFWPNAAANNAVVVDPTPATPPVDPNAPPAPVTP